MARNERNFKLAEELLAKSIGPELKLGLDLYLVAFIDLDTERTDLDPIPWSKIVQWCDYYGLNRRQTDDMLRLIRSMDNAVRKDREKKAKAAARKHDG